jgi:hypothetical protein
MLDVLLLVSLLVDATKVWDGTVVAVLDITIAGGVFKLFEVVPVWSGWVPW